MAGRIATSVAASRTPVNAILGRNLYFYKEPHSLGTTALILLIVTIGLLNICLGFGLAMHCGYGPPGLDGIFEALGTMPPGPRAKSLIPTGLGALYDPSIASESLDGLNVALSAGRTIAAPSTTSSPETLAEEKVLGDVRDLATAAQSSMAIGQVERRE